jgi:FlgD Ig-like domain
VGAIFNPSTTYYFGAQVFKGGLWSQITTNASASATTPAPGIKIDSSAVKALNFAGVCPVFDTSTNTIRIGWTMNRNAAGAPDSLDIGISYSIVSATADTVVYGNNVIVQASANTDTVAVKLHEDLVFNATYYVKLWLRNPGGMWTDPGAGSACTVHVPSFTWQSIVYFAKDPDTVYAFNREIRLMNQPLDVSTNQNIVRYVVPPSAATGNFTLVSVGFEFSVKDRGTPIYVGLKVDSVPAGFALTDVRIYRDSAGRMLLSREATVYDPANRYVSILTNDYDYPFVAMVDRQTPACQPLSNLAAYVAASKPVFDTVVVRDNIANCSWRYLTARGGDPYDTSTVKVGGFLNDTSETLRVMIDSNFVTQDNGVRALLIVDDGIHYDTVNLSRSVQTDGSDIAVTEAQNWVPLSVTAELDSPDARKVLRELPGVGAAWKYDDTKFRIFRCFPVPDQSQPWKWVEYSDTLAQEFEFVRGNIIWAKTLKQCTVRYGYSHTASLITTFQFRIPPNAWTDFAVPFKFDINVGDMLSGTSNGDSLEFYTWQRDVKSHVYKSELVFMEASGDSHFNNVATPLSSDAAGYTVYNPTSDTVVLNVPPLPVALSQQGLQKKKSVTSSQPEWTIRVAASEEDGSSLSSVYCGYAAPASAATRPGPVAYYPLAPSFGSAHVGVSDQGGKNVYGVAIAHAMAGGGCAYLLTFVNDGVTKNRISYHCDNLSPVPKGSTAAVWNGETGAFEDFSKGDATVTVEAGIKEYRTLLVGNAGYMAKARLLGRPSLLALIGTYPNPFRGLVRIRYSVPYTGVKNVKFTIYNLSGKVVWRHEVKDVAQSGVSDLVWNGTGTDGRPVAAGIYVLRMAALNSATKPLGVFERKMTFMP